MIDINTIQTGVAGEYFAAAELTKRGYLASITLRNTKGVDILCSNADASKTVAIQVKTNKGSKNNWLLGESAESYHADNLFYVFVKLNNNEKHPDFFIVPSKDVAQFCKRSHQDWLSTPARNGKKHKDSNMRKFVDNKSKYQNKWDLLGL